MNEKFEPSSDVKSQLKFIEELDKIEKKRHEEQEWEKIMKAAKVMLMIIWLISNFILLFTHTLELNNIWLCHDLCSCAFQSFVSI